MTTEGGKILAECAANMAVMRATGESFNQALGILQTDYRKTRDLVNQNTLVVEELQKLVTKELLPAIRQLPETVDGKIQYHEEKDPLHAAAMAAHKSDITQKLKHSKSIPPENHHKENKHKLRTRLIQATIAFLIAATSVLTTLAAAN